jgi:hypothetical protein
MFEGLFQLVHKAADKEIKLLIQPGTELPHLKEALCQFLGYVVQFEKDQLAQQAAAKASAAEPVVAPVVSEVHQ